MTDYFFLTSHSVPLLSKLIMTVVVTVYVGLFIPKNRTIKWFTIYLIAYTGLDFSAFLGQVWFGPFSEYHYPIQYLFVILLSYSYFSFALSFKSETFNPKKSTSFLIASVLAAYCFLHILYLMLTGNIGHSPQITIILAFPLLMFIGSAITFFRKFVFQKKQPLNEKAAQANLVFFILTLLAILLSFVFIFEAFGIVRRSKADIIYFTANLFIFTFLVVAFLKYLDIKTSLLVKLVGLTLVLFLLVIGLEGFLVTSNQSIPTILTAQGYDVSSISRLELVNQHRLVLQEMHDNTLPLVGFLVVSTFVILGLFPIIFDKSILQPIHTLLRGIQKVNDGDFDAQIPISDYDEIGYLTSHFNEMTKSLKQANESLKTYAESLEFRVEERTLELNRINDELKSINNKLAEKTTALEQMEQTRSRLFLKISHELRTPITLIRGPIEKILQHPKSNLNEKDNLNLVLRNTERLQEIVDQILDLNRWESGELRIQPNETNVANLLNIICVSYESLIRFNALNFSFTIPPTPVSLNIDKEKFEKIFANLISNAIKFTPSGGTISITLTEYHKFIEIIVSDTGIGITKEKVSHIFDPFEHTTAEMNDFRDGLGIGLSLTKKYIELHNGSISVESKPNEGTTFRLKFPKVDTKLESGITEKAEVNQVPIFIDKNEVYKPITSDTSNEKAEPTGATILLVEDNHAMTVFISSVLSDANYRVITANNGQEALKTLSKVNPDLIISDIMMPVMDGFTFLKKVKEIDAYRAIPTIFLSAISDMQGKLESLSIGVNDYLVKPFNTTELLYRIDNLLEFPQQRKEAMIELSDLPTGNEADSMIPKLTLIIEQRIEDNNLTVEQLAPEVAMSRSTLYREIKKRTGFSAGAFLKEIRLQKARQILESDSDMSLTEIVRSVGFQNTSYFNRIYHKRFGKWPSEYF